MTDGILDEIFMKIRYVFLSLIFLTVLFISSCKYNEKSEHFDKKDTIFLPLYGKNISLNPLQFFDSESARVIRFLLEPLLKVNEQGEIIPNLIEKWTYSEKGLLWTFKLDKSFDTLNINDIISTLNYLRDPGKAPFFSEKLEYVENIQKLDEYTFQVRLKEPYSPFPVIFNSIFPVPEHVLAGNMNDFLKKSSGPYILKNFNGRTIHLLRNETFWKSDLKPFIKNIVFTIYEDNEHSCDDLLSGKIDLVSNIDPEKYVELKEKDFICYDYRGQNYTAIGFNFRKDMFRDRRVREAISYSIGRDIIVHHLIKDLGEISKGPVQSFMSRWYNKDLKNYTFSPEKSVILMEQAGWYKGKSSFFKKNGKIFHFKLATNRGDRLRERAVTVIQQNLLQAGFAVETVFMERNEFLDKIYKGSLDSWCIDLVGEGTDPDDLLYHSFHSSGNPGTGNYGSYSNKEVDKLLSMGRREIDEHKRREIYYTLQSLVSEDLPVVFLYSRYKPVVLNRRIEIPEGTEGRAFDFYRDFYKWKIKY